MPRTTWVRAGRRIIIYLAAIRDRFPVSLHGVGLSIGGSGKLDREHLGRLKALIERYQPALFSEHLAWSSHDSIYLNDLLPLPYTQETLARVCEHIDEVQERLGRRMLLENPSTYVAFSDTAMSEVEFLREGCGAPAAVFCSTSTMCSSSRSIMASTRWHSSTTSRSSMSAKSISAGMRPTATTTARYC